MWRDIALANRDALLAEIDGYADALAAARALISAGDADALRSCSSRRATPGGRGGSAAVHGARSTRRVSGDVGFAYASRRAARRRRRRLAGLEKHQQPHAAPRRARTRHDHADGIARIGRHQVMLDALRALGIAVHDRGAQRYEIEGAGGPFPGKDADLHLGLSGLSMRTLVGTLAFCGGGYRADGVPRMRERPIGDLVDALRTLGADIRYEMNEGFPPLLIGRRRAARGERAHQGRRVEPVPHRAPAGAAAPERRRDRRGRG